MAVKIAPYKYYVRVTRAREEAKSLAAINRKMEVEQVTYPIFVLKVFGREDPFYYIYARTDR